MSAADGLRRPVSLYLHVPFCATKCAYCDFTSAPNAAQPLPEEGILWAVRSRLAEDATLADAFVAAVPLFLEEFVDRGVLADVPSVYVGGGTPTVLGDRLPHLIGNVLGMVGLAPGAEVTVEANPESVSGELVQALLEAGTTRVSLGVQSFDEGVLATLGRCHSAPAAQAAAAVLRDAGASFSVDLMCGVPGLTEAAWRESLDRAVTTGAGHVSAYALSVEPNTPLARRIAAGDLGEPDPDVAADHLEIAEAVLSAAGLRRYEVASWARPGEEARHNVGYWTGQPYLGIGPGAASMMPVPLALETPLEHYVRTWPREWRARFVLNDSLASFLGYLWDRQPAELEALTAEEAAREDAMLGLRMAGGVDAGAVDAAGLTGVLTSLTQRGLVEPFASPDGPRWRTTQRGWLLGNEVFGRVWAGE